MKGSDELIVEAEVSDMKECDEGILLVLNNGVLACIDKEKQSLDGSIMTLQKIVRK